MNEPGDDDLRQWLLQRLPPARAAALEEQLLRDSQLAERLREAETDLLDDFARGALSAEEDQAFRAHRLADAVQSGRLTAALAWAQMAAAAAQAAPAASRHAAGDVDAGPVAAPRETPAMSALRPAPRRRLAYAAAAVLAVAALLPLVWNAFAPAPQMAEIPTYTLLISTPRGEAAPPPRLPARPLRLQLEVADAARRYSLYADAAGQRLRIAAGLQPQQQGGYVYVETVFDAAPLATRTQALLLVDDSQPAETEQRWAVQIGPGG